MSGVRGRGRPIGTTSLTRPGRGSSPRPRRTGIPPPRSVVTIRSSPVPDQIRSNSMFSRWRVMSSSAPNGSSRRRTVGFRIRQRAIATRCRMPPESWAGLARSNPERPTSEIRSWIRPGSGWTPPSSSGSGMLLVTDRQGRSAASWKAMPSSWSRRTHGRPPDSAGPDGGVSRPAMIRRTVDLPQPRARAATGTNSASCRDACRTAR